MGTQPFGPHLAALLKQHGLSQQAFGDKVGVSQSYVAHVIKGITPLAIDRIDGWADALRLAGQERVKFRRIALYTHCPEEVVTYILELEDKL